MNKSLATISKGLLAIAVLSALGEADWRISLTLLAAGFGGLLSYGLAQGVADNDRYCAAVMRHKSTDSDAQIPTTSPYLGLLVLIGFFSVAFLSVYLDSPWPVGLAFVVTVAVGLSISFKRTGRRNTVWKQFALRHDLTFDEGIRWDYQKNAKITGVYGSRNIRLEIVWQDRPTGGTGRRRSEVLIAEVTTAIANVTFCIDHLRTSDSDPDLAKRMFESRDLMERIEAAEPRRISLFEESVTFHFPRVPATEVELAFYGNLLKDAVTTLERLQSF